MTKISSRRRPTIVSWPVFFVFLFLYRSLFSVLGQVFVKQFTKLGDTGQFQGGNATIDGPWFRDSEVFTILVGDILRVPAFGNPILINVYFQSIAFVGIYKFLMAVEPNVRKKLAFLVMLPSFTLWSSVASKESIVVFSVGILSSYFVSMYYSRERISWYHVLAAIVLALFKAHYAMALVFFVSVTVVAKRVRQKALIALIAGVSSMVPLYFYRDTIDTLSFAILPHFIGVGNSTREAFWVSQYDVFAKAPYGMFQAFFGPTLAEASGGLMQGFAFVESAILVGVLGFYFLRRLPEMPMYTFFVGLFTTFWVLFPNYPFGIMNPGSAIRYRTGYVMLLFLVFAFLMSRDLFVTWRGKAGERVVKLGDGRT